MDRRVFLTLYAILFTGSFNAGMVVPLLSGYAHSMGADSFAIGLVFGVASVSMICCHPAVGRFSDRWGRKPFIIAGLTIGIFTSIGFILSATVLSLLLVRLGQGMGGSMVGPVSQAYAGEIVPSGKEGFTMGTLNSAAWIGFGTGPVVSGLLKDLWSIESAFYARGVLCVIALAICIFCLPADRVSPKEDPTVESRRFYQLFQDRTLLSIFILRLAVYMCIGVFWAFAPLSAEVYFNLSGLAVGAVITTGTLVGALFLPYFGKLGDRTSRKLLITVGGLVMALATALFSTIGAAWQFYLVSVFIGLGAAVILPSVVAITVKSGARYGSMGRVVSLMAAADNLGVFSGPILCGALISMTGLHSAMLAIGSIMLVTTVAVYFHTSLVKGERSAH